LDQKVPGQSTKRGIEINEISARPFGHCDQTGEKTGIPRGDQVNHKIELEAINISTELARRNKKNNDDQDFNATFTGEYRHLMEGFEMGGRGQYRLTNRAAT